MITDHTKMFTAVPQNKSRAHAARKLHNSKIADKHLVLTQAYERETGATTSALKDALGKIDLNKKFDPVFGMSVEAARKALLECDAQSAIQHLMWVTKNSMTTDDEVNIQLRIPSEALAWRVAEDYFHNNQTLDYLGRRAKVLKTTCGLIDRTIDPFQNALSQIKQADAELYDELTALIHTVYIFNGEAIQGATFSYAPSAIYICIPIEENFNANTEYFIEHLVHESSHSLLHSLMSADCLILNSPDEKFDAPLRVDKRPIFGIFHASFVIARMVRIFGRLVEQGYTNYTPILVHFRERLNNGMETLLQRGRFTPSGQQVFESLATCAAT